MLGFRNIEDHTFFDFREKSLMQWLDDFVKHEDIAVRGGVKLAKEYILILRLRMTDLRKKTGLKKRISLEKYQPRD
jgi:hypothetical protein